jgi:hypothetical protein
VTQTDRLYTLSLVVAGSLMLVLPLRALAANVDLSNSHATLVCQEGETASIAGSNDTIVVRGHCGTIAIDGDANVVHADRADRVTFVGSHNTVYYGGTAPQLDVRDGASDELVAASASNAKAAAAVAPMPGATPSSAPSGSLAPGTQQMGATMPVSSATYEPVSSSIAQGAAQATAFEATAGALMGPADVALNGGNASDGFVSIVIGDGMTYDAACGGRTVEIGGDSGKVTLHGHCRFVRLAGNGVTLALDGADGLVVTGNGNRIRSASAIGSTEMFGTANAIAAR